MFRISFRHTPNSNQIREFFASLVFGLSMSLTGLHAQMMKINFVRFID